VIFIFPTLHSADAWKAKYDIEETHTCTNNHQIDLFHTIKTKVKCLRNHRNKHSAGDMQFMYDFDNGSLEVPGAPGAYQTTEAIGIVHAKLWVLGQRI
jgi:hypothetical protein